MALPRSLLAELGKPEGSVKYDLDEVKRLLDAFIADREVFETQAWFGPAWGDENLQLDLYLLTEQYLVNHWVRSDGTSATSCIFLDSLVTVSLIEVSDKRSPYVIALYGENGEGGRIYGDDKKEML